MIPQSFNYESPATLGKAFTFLEKYGEDAKIMSGGHSLIPMMKLRLATPAYIIDISGIKGMEYIKEQNGFLKIGALTKEVALEESRTIKFKYPILLDAAKMIADPSVRHMATIGGNLAHGDSANDHPAVMLALNAQVVVTSAKGKRTIPIDEFFLGFFTTALQKGEILTEILIPIPAKGSGGTYLKIERKVGDYATAGVAAQVTLNADGTVAYAGIGLTNVSAAPMRAARSEKILRGSAPTAELIAQAATAAAQDCDPNADLRGSIDYKRAMVRTLVSRALTTAIDRAKKKLK
jgi:aerobic carbon-monoxide dehydrogenase medium subunit